MWFNQGDEIKKGQKIAFISDVFGKTINSEINAEVSGKVIALYDNALFYTNQPFVKFAVL